ncbi:unnamed protein product [Danaus chrysippus]|uniref:(African queen) hypothetical protein n=1 Tax=Danaus chrysippus TaxID=151541 RepID=A0A8J2W4C0_9NEOP|nr:unnamed protein product [Danaus chrysippus]
MTEVSILVILLLIIECRAKETTVKTIIIETTTEYVTYITDIPEEDVNQALIQGYGRYTTQSFLYDNHQYHQAFPVDHERCIEDMIKCNADMYVT